MWGGFRVAWLTYFINVYLVRHSIDISSYSAELSILKVKYDRPGECSPEKDCLR